MKTRSKKGATKAATTSESTSEATPKPSLPSTVENPPKAFILPTNTSEDARILTFANPATDVPNRYFYCPERGFYEFTKVAAPKGTPRSLLFTGSNSEGGIQDGETIADIDKEEKIPESTAEGNTSISSGYVTKAADLFVATPFDAIFAVLPALAPKSKSSGKQMFLSLDDHVDGLGESSKHLKQILRSAQPDSIAIKRLSHICDTVDAGDEKMYRLSKDKLFDVLLKKSNRMSAKGLPPSMEEKFVRNALEAPITIAAQETTSKRVSQEQPVSQEGDKSSQENMDSQAPKETVETTATTVTNGSGTTVAVECKSATDASPEIEKLLRLRIAFNFLTLSYLAPHLRIEMQSMLSSQNDIDFTPLDQQLEHLNSLRKDAQALRSVSDNISRKRNFVDDEAIAAREDKKRKKEEEEKKKKNESNGLKQLKKADTSGMKKMSSFFQKVPAKKAT